MKYINLKENSEINKAEASDVIELLERLNADITEYATGYTVKFNLKDIFGSELDLISRLGKIGSIEHNLKIDKENGINKNSILFEVSKVFEEEEPIKPIIHDRKELIIK